jgi:hypothetical protein
VVLNSPKNGDGRAEDSKVSPETKGTERIDTTLPHTHRETPSEIPRSCRDSPPFIEFDTVIEKAMRFLKSSALFDGG